MYRRSVLFQSMLLAMLLPGAALSEVEVSGYLKNETAVFTKDGQVTGEARSMLDNEGHDKFDVMKFENSARFFLNGDLGEESSWHADINIIYDSEAIQGYRGHKLYTQNDWFRELYVDTSALGWAFRLGKQQVVWGTADGMKLLDIINPTDFRELNQNSMEDSRIPIWMINAERNVGDNGNIQLIVSQVEENKIPGLNDDGDSGQPFIMKGVDTITGRVNGFLNIAPALAKVAGSFTNATFIPEFGPGASNPLYNPFGNGLLPFAAFTVDGFAGSPSMFPFFPSTEGYQDLSFIAQCGLDSTCSSDPNANDFITNLMPVNSTNPFDSSWTPTEPTSAFEYMPMASFATFNTFSTLAGINPETELPFYTGATTEYVRDYPDDANANAGFRWKQSLDNGLNYSLNYFYHYGANPDINLSWHDAVTGTKLTEQMVGAVEVAPGYYAPDPNQTLTEDQLPTDLSTGALPATVLLHDDNYVYYGAVDPTGGLGSYSSNPVVLRFTETLHRMQSIGASFDYGMTLGDLPVVLRGEFLYDKDDKQPVVYRHLLSNGALANSLVMEDVDNFKYVLGVDVTVLTNMMVSGQFIQFRNLDYVDNSKTCTTQTGRQIDCSTYTADFATLSLTNDLNKAYENKEFYSLFFSKPFGPSQEHRWNNITIYEEGGGWWNRFDVEYSFTDTVLGSAEWNHYTGDENTTFGQFDKSSNFQLGVKWIFE